MKRILGWILAAILLLTALPIGALADGATLVITGAGEFVEGDTHTVTATVENAGEDTYEIRYAINGGEWTGTAPSLSAVGTYAIDVKATNTTNAEAPALTGSVTVKILPAPTLTATGGTFPYDGSAHGVSASVSNGEGYAIRYSTDGGSSWSADAPTFTDVGSYAVKVQATKEGAETLETTATVTVNPVLTATGGTFSEDGQAHKVEAKVLGAEGYTIEYSTDGGSTWSGTAPSLKSPGKLTVSVRALKSGAVTLTAADVTLEVVAGPALTATGGTFPEDGTEHKVEAKVTGGEGYTIEYSTDGGSTWSATVPSLKTPGKLTVKVRAMKSGATTLTAETTLEVTAKTVKTVKIVNCNSAVNVRAKASKSSKKLGLAKKGNVYEMLGKEGNWYKIQYTSTQVGFVHADYVKTGEGTVEPEPVEGKIVTIANCVTDCNVRAGGSQGSAKIGVAPLGKKYTYLGKEGSYYKIQYTDTKVGYVHQKYGKVSTGDTTTDPEPPTEGKIVTIVNCNTDCNVRAGGRQSSKLIGTAPRSKSYTYLGTSGNYIKIQYREKTVGYVHKSYAKVQTGTTTTDPEPTYDGTTGTIYNCKTSVNVRQSASDTSKLLGTMKKGVTVQILGTENGYTKIRYGTGVAYVFSKYVKVG